MAAPSRTVSVYVKLPVHFRPKDVRAAIRAGVKGAGEVAFPNKKGKFGNGGFAFVNFPAARAPQVVSEVRIALTAAGIKPKAVRLQHATPLAHALRDPPPPPPPTSEIKLSVPHDVDSTAVQALVASFEKVHPDVTFTFKAQAPAAERWLVEEGKHYVPIHVKRCAAISKIKSDVVQGTVKFGTNFEIDVTGGKLVRRSVADGSTGRLFSVAEPITEGWFFLDDNFAWQPCSDAVGLEAALVSGKPDYTATSDHRVVSFATMMQTRTDTRRKRAMARVEPSSLLLAGPQNKIQEVAGLFSDVLEASRKVVAVRVAAVDTEEIPAGPVRYERATPSEFAMVETAIQKSAPTEQVLSVFKVQNPSARRFFATMQKYLKEKRGDEKRRWAFHGTGATDPKVVCESDFGFDVKHSNAGSWGRGLYFAFNASLSLTHYVHRTASGQRQLLMAEVLVGHTVSMPSGSAITKPPGDHDSVTGKLAGSDIVIVYDNGRAYPTFLVTLA